MEDDAKLAGYAASLADAVDASIARWVERCVALRVREWTGREPDPDVEDAARRAGVRARLELGNEVRTLVGLDIDAQHTTPLAIVRRGVSYATEVLRAAGVPPVARDDFEERAFPEDAYGLTPASFADVDPALAEPGLLWGAAKAHVHLARRRHDTSD